MKAMATISLPKGLTPTPKKDGDGDVCVVMEGKMVDGKLEVTEMMSMEDYHKDMPEEMEKKHDMKKDMPMMKKGKKKRPARIAAILGDEDEGMGY